MLSSIFQNIQYTIIMGFVCTSLSNTVFAQDNISVNGLFIGKAIIKINGTPVMFFEGDRKQGITLISANEDQAIIEINGKRQTMFLDLSIATEYSKPVKAVPFGQSSAKEILSVEIVHQAQNIATFAVEYNFGENAEDYILIAQTMVNKKAVKHASYNYVPVKVGRHKTHISIGINETAPQQYQSDHILINFALKKTQKASNADTAKITAFVKNWLH